jgi:hypothetical protein
MGSVVDVSAVEGREEPPDRGRLDTDPPAVPGGDLCGNRTFFLVFQSASLDKRTSLYLDAHRYVGTGSLE